MLSKDKMKFWTVDAFAYEPYTGNPAAVIIVDEFPHDKVCQKVAAEIHLSETAFVKQLDSDMFHIRWFTPTVEVKLCGHATLAAAHVLAGNDLFKTNSMMFKSRSGDLAVSKIDDASYTLDFPLQKTQKIDASPFVKIFSQAQVCEIAKALKTPQKFKSVYNTPKAMV